MHDQGKWLRSPLCESAACVEVALMSDGRVRIRDSKHPAQEPLLFDRDEWAAFLAGAKAGHFDGILS